MNITDFLHARIDEDIAIAITSKVMELDIQTRLDWYGLTSETRVDGVTVPWGHYVLLGHDGALRTMSPQRFAATYVEK